MLHCQGAPQNGRLKKRFRNRFRTPHQSFIELRGAIVEHEMLSSWASKDAAGVKRSDTKLLLLGALRHIRRAWTFDDVEEVTAASR